MVPGGYCGTVGACGAALGVGIAFGVLRSTTPLDPEGRGAINAAVSEVLAEIAACKAARCCQRDSFTALRKAAEISPRYLPMALETSHTMRCRQFGKNRECIREACPLFPG